jgi:hypothetical protein
MRASAGVAAPSRRVSTFSSRPRRLPRAGATTHGVDMSRLLCDHRRHGAAALLMGSLPALLLIADETYGQSYSFEIPEATVTVEIGRDGSAKIDYDILFVNRGDAIDVVDIGMPTEDYVIGSCTADLDGTPQTDIRKSQYVETGIEVHLNPVIPSELETGINKDIAGKKKGEAAPVQPKGRLKVSCVNRNMVYEDTTDSSYASFLFTPTWFGSQYLAGTTNLQLRYILPGLPAANEIKWQSEPFDLVGKDEAAGKAMVVWNRPNYPMIGPHTFGVSFPRRLVENVIHISAAKLAWTGFVDSTPARVLLGLLMITMFTIGFFLLTRNTGCALWVILTGIFVLLLYKWPESNFLVLPAGIVLLAVGIRSKLRKTGWQYMRAAASVPGGGIRRGLTAVEAAVLLELPSEKILTILFFGLVKKGLLRLQSEDPPTVRLSEGPFQETLDKAKAAHVPVRDYEKEVMLEIDAVSDAGAGGARLAEVPFEKPMENLIRQVAEKVSGHDIAQTRTYYTKIIERAWREAQEGAPELRPEIFNASMDWLMLDEKFKDRWETIPFGSTYRPSWLGTFLPFMPASAGLPGWPGAAKVGGQLSPNVSLGDVAKSIAGKFENMSKSLVGAVDFSSLSEKGGINLSSLDKLTSDILTSSRTGGGGGGGSGCACACAGCACACACAGGGR